ncbi:hypothetical protein C8A00DRAFT_38655 [Chaetomidium leptoderma]|uniref:Uncharacterized protein n=1 Tax=Chaetomidium leptoderma TaxID=669021 RepID=A0AAN6VC90_9PEZI|nr:hypothetical protein C8A00DRAFT_38655 [Chaetomidium leptoderma]
MASLDAILDQAYRDLLDSAIRNVLSTERALEIYADHPVVARHTSLCPGAADTARAFLSELTLSGTLTFDDDDDEYNPEPNVYLHSDYTDVTFRVWRALNEQQ